jgi:putative ABC transport system permease protein
MSEILLDVRNACRMLKRAPWFSCLAIVILGTGIGAATLMFTLVHGVLLRSLPFNDPERVVWMYNLRTERDRAPLSIPDVEDYRRESSTLAGLAVFTNWTVNLTGVGPSERLEGTRVSGNFFELLGLRPLLGRPLQADDEQRQNRVIVLTHGLWVRRFGADPDIVGRGVSLNGATYTIVGVLPAGFMFPFREAELAVPLSLGTDPRRGDRGANFLRVVARLAPGVTVEQARTDLNAIAHRLQTQYPTENARKTGVSLYPLHMEIVRDYRGMLWTLFGAVGVLLAVGCGNLANLLLVRTAGRQTEFAVRISLGASRGRLMRQLVIEAAVLATAGGFVGVGLAAMGLTFWRTWGPGNFPRMAEVSLDPAVLLFAIGVSGATALACGFLPIWCVSGNTVSALRGATRAMTAGRGHAKVRRTFVGLQVAASTVLLVGLGVTARGFARLERIGPGFMPDQALSVQLSLPPNAYANRDALVRFSDSLRDRLTAMAGVETTGMVSLLPLSGLLSTMDVAFPDRPAPPADEVPQAHFRVADPGYFAAGGIRVLEGRAFTDHDREDGQLVAIVSRTFGERHWPGDHAVGKSVQLVQTAASAPLEIVGVVNDVRHFALDAPPTADLYVPLRQMPASQAVFLAARMFWVVRARVGSPTLARDVREAVLQVDPGVATSSARTLEAVLSASLGPRRVNVQLLAIFGQIAVALCAIGVYAVAAFSTRTRSRELAIRAALGARRRELTTLLLNTELWPVVTGIGFGLAAAYVAAPALFGTPFQTDPRDTITYIAVGAGLLMLAVVASYVAVRRASAMNLAALLQAS